MSATPRPAAVSKAFERHAFVVDDEVQVRAFVSNVLTTSGFKTHQLGSGQELEGALAQWMPDVIVLDLSLGDSDAIEVIRSLAASGFGGQILLISGHAPGTLMEVQKIGEHRGLAMLQPLQKPFRIEEMRARLAEVPDRTTGMLADVSLAAGLKNNWLELWYQPKIDLKSMTVCGAEALIRLRHPQHGVVLPSGFLPPAGDPLYSPLTDFIVRRSLADWMTFAEKRMTSRLAINVPASILQRPDFVTNLRKHLPTHPRFPGLIVEITEDEAIKDPELAREIAVQLKLYNVHVSIDDFGSGHSSLARLNELPFAEIKVDRSFVNGCADDPRKRAMCEAVMELARRFDIVAVAEGVETREDLKVLMEIGYPVAQGFFFAKPMRSSDFVELLISRAQRA
jgi:EAL domain-containing protein (putative c-di-GMP-specific phosphodiesterase class I)/ActR/RegA family two-component response regulator